MAINTVPTMPEDKWCYTVKGYSASYDGNKIYVGRSNNLRRHTRVNLVFLFSGIANQKEFFDWWDKETDRGGRPFYMKLPLFGSHEDATAVPPEKDKYYLLVQNKPFIQSIDKGYKISASFIIYSNKTKDESVAPIAYDVLGDVRVDSSNNVIMLRAIDPDGTVGLRYEIVGDSTGVTVKGASILYNPPSSFAGAKTFKYRATDGVLWSNEATISIQITEHGVPVAHDMNKGISEDVAGMQINRTFALRGVDPDGGKLVYAITDAGNCAAKITAMDGGSYVSISPPDNTMICNFKYKVTNVSGKDSYEGIVTTHPQPHVMPTIGSMLPSSVLVPQSYIDDRLTLNNLGASSVINKINSTLMILVGSVVNPAPSISVASVKNYKENGVITHSSLLVSGTSATSNNNEKFPRNDKLQFACSMKGYIYVA